MFTGESYWGRQEHNLHGPKNKSTGGGPYLVKLDILSGAASILPPHFPQLPEPAPSSDLNNEMLIGFIAASNLKKPSQKSPLLQTHPSKRDIS